MATRSKGPPNNSLADIRAIKACLEELESHAAANGAALAANLIGAASRALADELAVRGAGQEVHIGSEIRTYDA